MSTAWVALRIAFGVMLIAFAGMMTFGWDPPDVPARAGALRDQLAEAGYVFPTIAIVYLAVGVSYVAGRFVALATIVLFPITLNVVLFHAFLVPETLHLTAFLVVPQVVMLCACREAYRPLLRARPRRSAPP